MTPRRWFFIISVGIFLWPAMARAEIDQPSEVPRSVSAQKDLVSQHSALVNQWDTLQKSIAEQNAQCSQIQEDSPMVDSCRSNQAKILSEVKTYKANLKQYEDALKQVVFVQILTKSENRGAPLNALFTNDENNRSAFNYAKVIDQFRVEESKRYKPGEKTYCNIFVWDVTRAMGAEIPHHVLKGDEQGASAVDENGQFKVKADERDELNVNSTVAWLKEYGKSNGWRRVDTRMAQQMASEGHPAVAIWENPNSDEHGHIAIIRPGSLPLSVKGAAIAQAGRYVLDAKHLTAGFRNPKVRKSVQYWYHE